MTDPLPRPLLRKLLSSPEELATMLQPAPAEVRASLEAQASAYRDAKRELKRLKADRPGGKGVAPDAVREANAGIKSQQRQVGDLEASLAEALAPWRTGAPSIQAPAPPPERTAPSANDALMAPSDSAPSELEFTELADRQRWDAYVDAHPRATFYHRSLWLDMAEARMGHAGHRYAMIDEAGDVHGILPLTTLNSRLFGHFGVSLPWVNYGGALGASPEIEERLMQEAASRILEAGASHVEFRDTAPRDGWPSRTDKVCMQMALAADVDTQWKTFTPKLRAQIRKPEKEPHEFVTGGQELVGAFHDVFARNMRDLGTPVYARDWFDGVLEASGDAATIALLRHHGRPVSAGVLLHWRERMEIPWASTIRSANRLGMNSLFYWHVLRYAIGAGARCFDFGRSTVDAGTYRFKRQWGARPSPCHWHYAMAPGAEMPRLNPDNPRYALAISLWQHLPVAVTRMIGPPIVRNLP